MILRLTGYWYLVLIMYASEIIGQSRYGYEWIDAQKPHIKVAALREGLYRVSVSSIQSVNPAILEAPSTEICVYNLGRKVPVYLSWTGASPQANDYIEFWGTPLGGQLDQMLFRDTNTILNPYVSASLDTNYYFITLRPNDNLQLTTKIEDTTVAMSLASHCIVRSLVSFRSVYDVGRRVYHNATDFTVSPLYESGEGWSNGSFTAHSIPTPGAVSVAGYTPQINFRLYARNQASHRLSLEIGSQVLLDTSFFGSGAVTVTKSIPQSWIGSQSTLLRNNPKITNIHGYALGYASITYARNFDYGSKDSNRHFWITSNSDIQKFRVSSFNRAGGEVILYNYTLGTRQSFLASEPLTATIPAGSGTQYEMRLVNQIMIQTPIRLSNVNFNFSTLNSRGDLILITDPILAIDSAGNNVIEAYRQYKSTAEGGNHRAIVTYRTDLDEWFGYGIPRHPIAIRKYLQWAKSSWSELSSGGHVLLIGKGRPFWTMGTQSASFNATNFIPAYGHPLSDLGYVTMDTSANLFMNIGRLSVTSPTQIWNYLSKLQAYQKAIRLSGDPHQTADKKLYLKEFAHLSGGLQASEKTYFRNNLAAMQTIVEKAPIGARVYNVSKQNADDIPTENILALEDKIKNGVGIVTFFGHSSATIIDVGISDPQNLRNKDKYPIFIANGCLAGDIYTATNPYSEQFVLGVDKGAIAYIATPNNALDAALYHYSSEFYQQMSNATMPQTVGDIARLTTNSVLAKSNQNLNYLTGTSSEMIIHGDPSLPMPYYPLPDYYIDQQHFNVSPRILTETTDSIRISAVFHNLGKAIDQIIKVKIRRVSSNGQKDYDYSITAPLFSDTFIVSIPTIEPSLGIGTHQLSIRIDADNLVTELSESNNEPSTTVSVAIVESQVSPIYPYDYHILSDDTLRLHANAQLPASGSSTRYLMNLDTSFSYNSAHNVSHSISSTYSNISWIPTHRLLDSVVYYWRIAIDSTTNGQSSIWRYISFLRLTSAKSSGWNQSHYYQWLNNSLENFYLDTDRTFKLYGNKRKYEIRVSRHISSIDYGNYSAEWYLDNIRRNDFREFGKTTTFGSKFYSGIHIVHINSQTGKAELSYDTIVNGHKWGSNGSWPYNYNNFPRWGFTFPDTGISHSSNIYPNTPWNEIALNYLNQIPNGEVVFVYSKNIPTYTQWSTALVDKLRSMGLKSIDSFKNGLLKGPFILVTKINTPSFTPISLAGADIDTKLATQFELDITPPKSGNMTSPKIGPCHQWTRLQYRMQSLESPSTDRVNVYLWGYNQQGVRQLLRTYSGLQADESISDIDSKVYPYLELSFNFTDSIHLTPPQIQYWRILFDREIPELVTNQKFYYQPLDTLYQGAQQSLNFGVENISKSASDSVALRYTISQGTQSRSYRMMLPPIAPLSIQKVSIPLGPNDYYTGLNKILVEINPEQDSKHFIESNTSNNFLEDQFYVKYDRQNPLLNVTFDGVRILDQELISANPNIQIQLLDENPNLPLNDTSLISLSIIEPSGVERQISFASPELKFIPAIAGAKRNMATIDWKPTFGDGTYQLIIKDRDQIGNSSGNTRKWDYKISFRVISKMMVSHVLNYPNPFSTATQFVFTLTGHKVPDRIQIQILNVRGQVVKTIHKDMLGPLRIGLNRTQYTWDGRDDFGHLLANGVYLYRVDISDQDKSVEQMKGADFGSIYNSRVDLSQFFNDNYGKIVILR